MEYNLHVEVLASRGLNFPYFREPVRVVSMFLVVGSNRGVSCTIQLTTVGSVP